MATEKTIREWFEELPEPQRSQAIDNAHVYLDWSTYSLSNAIAISFSWQDSPQGYKYWEDVCSEISAKEDNKTAPDEAV